MAGPTYQPNSEMQIIGQYKTNEPLTGLSGIKLTLYGPGYTSGYSGVSAYSAYSRDTLLLDQVAVEDEIGDGFYSYSYTPVLQGHYKYSMHTDEVRAMHPGGAFVVRTTSTGTSGRYARMRFE